jgi:hypothetical protein
MSRPGTRRLGAGDTDHVRTRVSRPGGRGRPHKPGADDEQDGPPLIAEAPFPSLLTPVQRPVPQHFSEPEPLRLSPTEERLDDVWCEAGERQEPADVGVRDALLLRKFGDRLRAAALDLAPPAVRTDKGLDQRLVAARLRRRWRRPFRRRDQLAVAAALQVNRHADGQSAPSRARSSGPLQSGRRERD